MKKEKKLITLFFIYIIQGLRLYLKALSVSLDYIKARGEIFTKICIFIYFLNTVSLTPLLPATLSLPNVHRSSLSLSLRK